MLERWDGVGWGGMGWDGVGRGGTLDLTVSGWGLGAADGGPWGVGEGGARG